MAHRVSTHPGFAHHHQDLTFNPGPFFGARDCDCEAERDFKIEGQGLLGVFVSGVVSGIGVHQIEEQGLQQLYPADRTAAQVRACGRAKAALGLPNRAALKAPGRQRRNGISPCQTGA